MGNLSISKILDPLGLFSKDEKPEPPPVDPGPTARKDPVDEDQAAFRAQAKQDADRRARIKAQKPVQRAQTGLRVSLSGDQERVGVQTK